MDNAFGKATHANEDYIKGIFVPQHAEDGYRKETSFEPIDQHEASQFSL